MTFPQNERAQPKGPEAPRKDCGETTATSDPREESALGILAMPSQQSVKVRLQMDGDRKRSKSNAMLGQEAWHDAEGGAHSAVVGTMDSLAVGMRKTLNGVAGNLAYQKASDAMRVG